MSKRKSTILSSAVRHALRSAGAAGAIAGLGFAAAGHAQDRVDEEIVVKGVRGSLQQSIETKREAITVVDAITAEDVGKFPDKNLAEALQRVPGVVINREFGEGERVSVRGTDRNLTLTQLDGHNVATADWFILDQLNATRSFNYLMLPSEIIGQVVVHKTPQADFEEGGIGATINVITRKPLDLEPFTLHASAQGAYSERSDETDPQVSSLLSWHNDDETFGVLLAGVRQERSIRRDGVEVLGYTPFDTNPDPDATENILVPSLIGSALFEQERVRTGGNFAAQLRPSDDLELTLTGLYSEFDAENVNRNFLAWGSRALGDGGTLTNATVVEDTAVAGTIASPGNGTSGFGVVYDTFHRFAKAETRSIDLDTNWAFAPDWNMHVKVGYTEAEGNTEGQPFVEFGAPAAFEYDLRGRTPEVNFLNLDPTDPSDVQFIFSSLHEILNDDSETYGYVDFERRMEGGRLSALKFGAKVADHDRDVVFNATTYGGFHAPINTTLPSTFASGGLTPADFLENLAGAGTLTDYWTVDTSAADEILFAQLANTSRILYPQQNFSVGERSYAGYVMGNFEGPQWRANAGVRLVYTEQNSTGAKIRAVGGQVMNPFGNFDPVDVDRDYTEVLPSFNFAYDLSDQIIARFAAARVMTRADYTDIAPRLSLNIGAQTGAEGNPDLDPYLANQADISVEWYPNPDALFALAVFYKDVESFVTDDPVQETVPIQTGTPPANCTPTPTPDVFNCPFVINHRINGSGNVQGYEMSLTTPLWGDFGMQANYTFADAETDNGDPMPGNSRDQLNLTAYYENEAVSARLAYTYRSEFFVTFDRSTQLNQDSLESLDASLIVNVLDNVALTFDGINLTNDKIVQFATDTFRPRAIYDNGRIYYAGVRVKF